MPQPVLDNVRGRINDFVTRHANLLDGPVLEVGTAVSSPSRVLIRATRPDLDWMGLDMVEGPEVDIVADVEDMPEVKSDQFGSVVCTEVLEHLWRPGAALTELHRILRRGGVILVTTLFAFPYHSFPDDYWRFSRTGLSRLMAEAGFQEVNVEEAGILHVVPENPNEVPRHRKLPMHVFGCGWA